MALILGIDPGVNGGLALMAGDGELLATAGMPSVLAGAKLRRKKAGGSPKRASAKPSQRRRVDVAGLARLVCAWREEFGPIEVVALESVGANPRWAGVTSFAFGRAFGAIEGALAVLGIAAVLIPSRTWRKTIVPEAREGKGDVVAWYRATYPGIKRLATRQAQREGIADATAIAEFWRRKGGKGREVA